MRDLIVKTCDWHVKWTTFVHEWARRHEPDKALKIPSMRFSLEGGRTAGYFRRHERVCVYSLPYVCSITDAYEEVVAHEVCHAYQWQVYPGCKAHGEFFRFMLNVVCGFKKAKHTHSFRTKPTKQLQAVFVLHQSQIIEAINDVKAEMQDVVIKNTGRLQVCASQAGRDLAVDS